MLHTEMTELAINLHPEIKDIVHKYDLKIKLDNFGYGKFIFHGSEEVGFYFKSRRGITLHLTRDYGGGTKMCVNYNELSDKINEAITSREVMNNRWKLDT